jgi:DNA-binding transcriptional LysR family regulator
MRQLSFRQIEAFRALVEGGTVTRAAELLHVSQPAVSKQLAHLEADCGVPIFDRARGRLELTDVGTRLYEEVSKIFVGINQLQDAVEVIRREEQGRLVVGISPALSHLFEIELVQSFLGTKAATGITMVATPSQQIAERLKRRQLDVGFLFPNFQVSNAYLENEEILSEPVVCLVSRKHVLAKRKEISVEHLIDVPLIASPPGSQTRRLLNDIFASKGAIAKTIVETTTITNIAEFVARGFGASLIHPLFAPRSDARVVAIPFLPERNTHMLISQPRDARNRRLADVFASLVKEVLRNRMSRRQAAG